MYIGRGKNSRGSSTVLFLILFVSAGLLFASGCSPTVHETSADMLENQSLEESTLIPYEESPAASPSKLPSPTKTTASSAAFNKTAPSKPTPIPTSTKAPTPTNTATATVTPSPTKAGICSSRIPSDDLLTLVTSEFAISSEYVPADLVNLSDLLPLSVTLGYDTQLRREAAEALVQMVNDMLDEGLSPQIISGYRSYIAQRIAWQKWQDELPERAAIISLPPGHSEHQLGTTVDFGSPELAAVTGDEEVEFHTYFYKTSEGQWLEENAQEYGFTQSYPENALEVVGFAYEPWHYRYIGVELAKFLKSEALSLTEYLTDLLPPPCDP